MNTEALLRVAELLEHHKPAPLREIANFKALGFDMQSWVWSRGPDPEWDTTTETNYCGTTVCACGLAALDPWFQARGFMLIARKAGEILHTVPVRSAEELPQYSRRGKPGTYFEVTHKDKLGSAAVKDFFGLTRAESQDLFGDLGYHITPLLVAQNIRAFVAGPEMASPPALELVDAP
jgi:hypothetical protein